MEESVELISHWALLTLKNEDPIHRTYGSPCGEEIDEISWVNWRQRGVDGKGGRLGT